MRLLITAAAMLLTATTSFAQWNTNFREAQSTAAAKKKLILLNFSGSDWCGPCIRLKKEIFDSPEFTKMADTTLIMVNADFPRARKNQLVKSLQDQNNQLADQYNKNGIFPLTVILTPDGKTLKIWEGYPKMTNREFIEEIKRTYYAYSRR